MSQSTYRAFRIMNLSPLLYFLRILFYKFWTYLEKYRVMDKRPLFFSINRFNATIVHLLLRILIGQFILSRGLELALKSFDCYFKNGSWLLCTRVLNSREIRMYFPNAGLDTKNCTNILRW